jgi:hypothetical protein
MNVARIAVFVGLFLAAGTATILLFVDPPPACPDWHQRGSSHSFWVELAYTAPFLAIACFIVFRWDWCLQQVIEADEQVMMPAYYVLTAMCIVGAAVAQIPLLFIIDCATR